VAKKGAHHALSVGLYGPGARVDRIIVGSAPAVIPGGRKHPGRLTTLIRSRGGSRQALGAGSPEQAHQILPRCDKRTTKGVQQVLRVGLYAIFAHAGSGPAGRCGFALGRTERQLRKSCRSQVRTKFRANRMRRNSGFCARNSRSRGVLMLSDGYRSR
jgi:hypothetical protein